MFNLFISFRPDSWDLKPYELERSRSCIEYTADEISERYKFFSEKAIDELKSFPCLFVTECEQTTSKIGYITNIQLRSNSVIIEYEFDPELPELPINAVTNIGNEIDLGRLEISRTHWAVKDVNLFNVLLNANYLTEEQVKRSIERRTPTLPLNVKPETTLTPSPSTPNTKVFIVHGHDEVAKLDVADFVKSLGLEPVILHMQPSSGRTIIEKIEAYTDVGFAVVLYTPCDVGGKNGKYTFNPRARQNVVFEHGYLIAKLGRDRVSALVKGSVETPNDISGVVYIAHNENDNWKDQLKSEMRAAGYSV